MEKSHRIPTIQIFQVDESRVFLSAFEVVPFCNSNLVFRLLEEASMPIFHASKLESPTSVSHGIQRSKFTLNPQLALLKKILPDWASTLKALTRRMPLRVMAFLEAKKPQNYICIKFDPPKIGSLITPAIMWDWILDFSKRSFQNTKSSLEAASAIKPSLLVTTSIQNHLPG